MEVIGFICIAVIVIAVIFTNGIVLENNRKKAYRESLKKGYGNASKREFKDGEYSHICGYDSKHQPDFRIDDITWNDLDMDAVFMQMDYAKSSAGEEYLYYVLRNPQTVSKDWKDFEKKTDYFQKESEERLKLQLLLHEMGYTGKYSIYDYLDNLDTLGERSNLRELVVDILFIPAILLLFFQIGYGIGALFILILYNLVSYFKEKEKIDPYITCFAYVFRILNEADKIISLKCDCLEEEKRILKERKKSFGKFKRFSSLIMSKSRMSGNPTEIIIDYARMFFHLDIIKFNSMLSEVKKHTQDIDMILTIIGKLDLYLSVGEYRTFLKEYCIPDFTENHYSMTEVYHPLLEDPVKNSIAVKKSVLLTGSNASGKSTFLKTVALNALLAQSIHTVAAKNYEAPYFKIFTSLSLKDNIFDGDSFYMAEIKSIKRMIDASKNNTTKVLCFVDEVLRGTNTIERISASSVILKVLSECNGYCFAATHDIELTDMVLKFYENYHFEEDISGGDISFSYQLYEGKAVSRNAIMLLRVMGYESEVTDEAEAIAENFEQQGKWEKLS